MKSPLAVWCAVLLSVPALAKEAHGVKAADTVTVDGKELKLNGLGLRKKFLFKVYVGALYLEEPSSDPVAILAKDQTRRFDMHLMRDLDKKSMADALKSGFEANVPADKLPALRERLEKLLAVLTDVKEGKTVSVVYVPGKGTSILGGGSEFTAEGKDFGDAMFSIWLGKSPVDGWLKDGVLGK